MNSLRLTIVEQEKSIKSLSDFNILESKMEIIFPSALKDFLLLYEGAIVKETYYKGKPTFKEILCVCNHPIYSSIEAILEGHKYYKIEGMIPFAIDSGGWDYNFSVKPETFGQVWVNKFDSGDDNPLELVCNSFEDFVNELKEEQNV